MHRALPSSGRDFEFDEGTEPVHLIQVYARTSVEEEFPLFSDDRKNAQGIGKSRPERIRVRDIDFPVRAPALARIFPPLVLNQL